MMEGRDCLPWEQGGGGSAISSIVIGQTTGLSATENNISY